MRPGASCASFGCSRPAGPTSSAFARDLEAKGRARATITRRLCTIAGFYKYAVEEELLEHSPAAHVRRPRLDYESHATGLDRNELGGLLVGAGSAPPSSMRSSRCWR
jgi:site-specific recombinase XerD